MKLKFGFWSLTPYLMVVLLVGLQACGGGGGGSTTPADAKPAGYYSGTLTTVSPSQTDITAKAISDSDKFMMVHIDNGSPQNTILYVGTFTNITSTTFTADVRIYLNGVFQRTSTITNGSITEKSSMSGTLSGTGQYTATSFSLSYDTTINARTPSAHVDGDTWALPSATNTGFNIFLNPTRITVGFENNTLVTTNLRTCYKSNVSLENVNSEQPSRIRSYSALYAASGSCTGSTMTGYITPFDNGGTDNRYLWITYNDTNSFAGELVKQ